MEAKQKIHLQLFTEGNAQFTHPTEDTLCARFNTSYTKEDSPTNAFKSPFSSQLYIEPEDDELLVLRKNNENIKDRLKRLSNNLYQKGVIQNQDLVHTISQNTKRSSKRNSQVFTQDECKLIKSTKLDDKDKKVSHVPMMKALNKENKKAEFSPRNNMSPRGDIVKPGVEKLIKDEAQGIKKEVQAKPKAPVNRKVSGNKSKSPLRAPPSPIITKKTEKKHSPVPRVETKDIKPVSKHYRKGSTGMPSDVPITTEKYKKKVETRGYKTPTLSPRMVQKTARDNKERKETEQNTSLTKPEVKEKQAQKEEGDDILVQINIKCYSPSKKEKSPKSEEDLIKALKMVRKFIDKSIGDESKLKKLTALLNKPNQQQVS